jgi:hypothetical protein
MGRSSCWILMLMVMLVACTPHAQPVAVATVAGMLASPSPTVFAPTIASTPTLAPPTATSVARTPVPLQFELLGVPASYNPSRTHWALYDLQSWHDRIYLAHGDWASNTGPVRALYFDTEASKVVQDEGFVFDEEAIEKFHVYGDVLYAPGIDATQSWDFGNVYSKTWGGTWTKRRTIPRAGHVFDLAVRDNMLVASALTDRPEDMGCIFTSVDDGESWQRCYQMPPGVADPLAYGSLFVLNGQFYATTAHHGCYVLKDETWAAVACLPNPRPRIGQHVIFRDMAVMIPHWRDVRQWPELYFFNGTEQWSVGFRWAVRDAVASPQGLYVLTGTSSGHGAIHFASDLTCHCVDDFTLITEFDMSSQSPEISSTKAPLSLELAARQFYVGFEDGRLFRSQPYGP